MSQILDSSNPAEPESSAPDKPVKTGISLKLVEKAKHTPSRTQAMDLAETSSEGYALQDRVINPLVDQAATELVELDDKGHHTNIELKGRPYDVLENLYNELETVGASHFVTKQVLEAFEEFALHEGSNFSKQAKAKPLYARILVTNEKPDDLPDVEKFQYIFLDGNRRQGRDATNLGNIRPTIHGTQSTGSNLPGLDELFEMGKKKGLLLFFASIDKDDLNQFDTIDSNLISILQAFMGDELTIDQLEDMLLNDELSPEAIELIETIAEYQNLIAESETPGAVENLNEQLAELEEKIETLLDQDLELPEQFLDSIQERFELVQNTLHNPEKTLQALDPEAAEDLIDLIENLQEQISQGELDELPPDIQALLDQFEDIEALIEEHGREYVIEQLAEAFADPENLNALQETLLETVQTIILTLNDPDIQAHLPQDALNQTNIFFKEHADIVDHVVRQSLIENLQATIEAMEPDADNIETIEALEELIEQLENGEDLSTIDSEILQEIVQDLPEGALAHIEQVIETLDHTQSEPVILSNETLEKLDLVSEDLETLKEALQDMIENAGDNAAPEQIELLDKTEQVIDAIAQDPSNIMALEELVTLSEMLSDPDIAALLPDEFSELSENLSLSIEDITQIQETALAIHHDVSVQELHNFVEIITTLKAHQDVLESHNIELDQVLNLLTEDITSLAAAHEITKLQETLKHSAPELAKALETQIDTILETQTQALSDTLDIKPEQVKDTLESLTKLEDASTDIRDFLKEQDVKIDQLVKDLQTDLSDPKALKELAKLQSALSEAPPELQEKIRDEFGESIDHLIDTQKNQSAKALNIKNKDMLDRTIDLSNKNAKSKNDSTTKKTETHNKTKTTAKTKADTATRIKSGSLSGSVSGSSASMTAPAASTSTNATASTATATATTTQTQQAQTKADASTATANQTQSTTTQNANSQTQNQTNTAAQQPTKSLNTNPTDGSAANAQANNNATANSMQNDATQQTLNNNDIPNTSQNNLETPLDNIDELDSLDDLNDLNDLPEMKEEFGACNGSCSDCENSGNCPVFNMAAELEGKDPAEIIKLKEKLELEALNNKDDELDSLDDLDNLDDLPEMKEEFGACNGSCSDCENSGNCPVFNMAAELEGKDPAEIIKLKEKLELEALNNKDDELDSLDDLDDLDDLPEMKEEFGACTGNCSDCGNSGNCPVFQMAAELEGKKPAEIIQLKRALNLSKTQATDHTIAANSNISSPNYAAMG